MTKGKESKALFPDLPFSWEHFVQGSPCEEGPATFSSAAVVVTCETSTPMRTHMPAIPAAALITKI